MRRMRWRAMVLAISFALLSLGALPREGAASPRFLPAEPPPVIGDPDGPDNGPYFRVWLGVPFVPISFELRLPLPSEVYRPQLVHPIRARKAQK
jgi:hypothetical protein